MASVYHNLMAQLARIEIKVPAGVDVLAAREIVAKKALPKLILEAIQAGVQPTLTDWLEMPDEEKALWQQYREEMDIGNKMELAAVLGNAAAVEVYRAGHDDRAARMAALQQGLNVVV